MKMQFHAIEVQHLHKTVHTDSIIDCVVNSNYCVNVISVFRIHQSTNSSYFILTYNHIDNYDIHSLKSWAAPGCIIQLVSHSKLPTGIAHSAALPAIISTTKSEPISTSVAIDGFQSQMQTVIESMTVLQTVPQSLENIEIILQDIRLVALEHTVRTPVVPVFDFGSTNSPIKVSLIRKQPSPLRYLTVQSGMKI